MMRKSKGFTLVEMLIVIAVIGVLAVAVLSAINPIEQMRKARDTRRKSNAAELLNALERYYATHEVYPSSITTNAGTDNTCEVATGGGEMSAYLTELMDENELKPEFSSRITDEDNYLYVGIDADDDLATVCYQIESAANISKYTGAENYCESGDTTFVCVPE